jgi:hypothetical protein
MSRLKQAAHFASFGGPARNLVDMLSRKWGKLTAVKKGGLGSWYFRCDCGNEVLKEGHYVRNRARLFDAGKALTAPSCGGCSRD